MIRRVAVLGASVAGVGVVTELRQQGFAGEIVLIDSQPHLPYDRPPLSKSFLLEQQPLGAISFHAPEHYSSLGVDLRLGASAIGLDAASRIIKLGDGERVGADAIVIATGARARLFPAADKAVRIWTIREADDASEFRKHLVCGSRLGVIGGGFIGAEIASSARKLGLDVAIFEAAALPFQHIVGPEIAARLAKLHRDAGIELHCNATISAVRHVDGKHFIDVREGGSHTVDIVVAGLGSLPNVEWLEGSGIDLQNGVVCDEYGRTSAAGVFAAGDAANWYNPKRRKHVREEHWTSAREQARIVARAITNAPGTLWEHSVPYFWSDLHGKRFQVLGLPSSATDMRIIYSDDTKDAFVAEYWCGEQLVGVAGCNAAAKTMRYLARLAEPRAA